MGSSETNPNPDSFNTKVKSILIVFDITNKSFLEFPTKNVADLEKSGLKNQI